MYSNLFGKRTETFIAQDVYHLSKNHNLLYVCNIDYGAASSDKVKVIKARPLSFFQKTMRKCGLPFSYRNQHFQEQLTRVIDEFKPDLIHCQFGYQAIRLIDNLDNETIPVVIQFHGYDASKRLSKKSYVKRLREIMERDNYYSIFVAESLRKNLEKHNITVRNSMILHCGIDLEKFSREKAQTHDDFIFLQVSSLAEKKGHEYTLEAFARFLTAQKSKNYKLILTGDGKRKEQLKRLSAKLNIHNHVEFVGFVSPDEAKNLMQNADVFVHHSITPESGDEEGIPNALMEAMAMELPVISSYHAGIPELVTDGVNGYLVKEKDVNAYALRMRDIISWKKLRINRDVIAAEFEIVKHIEKLERFYSDIIAEPVNNFV
jgi:glycosyltransferase involved in cell wall biosynthesis